MKLEVITPVEIEPSVQDGVDHGAEGKILLRYKEHRLVWRAGHNAWGGIGSATYRVPNSLEVMGHHDTSSYATLGMPKQIFEGGRLSHKRLGEYYIEIMEAMNIPEDWGPGEIRGGEGPSGRPTAYSDWDDNRFSVNHTVVLHDSPKDLRETPAS